MTRSSNDEKSYYLAEWKPIHFSLSATVYGELQKSQSPAFGLGESSTGLAVFGDPSYPEVLAEIVDTSEKPFMADHLSRTKRMGFEWFPLIHSRREVEGIAALFPQQTKAFLGFEASEDRVKNLTRDTRIVHLSAHAYTDDQMPLSSFVAMSIPENFSRVRENGLLQVWEIFEQVRLDADLVVLSGCSTGMGKKLLGEGLIGLTRAFQYAGASSVVSSLWNVSDHATADLMVRFYRHIRNGRQKNEALRAAQLEFIRGSIVSSDERGEQVEFKYASAPYYWAGFQLYGDWGNGAVKPN